MSHERWWQIRQLFKQALALPPDERHGWLAAACADDVELQHAVEAQLSAWAETTADDELVEAPISDQPLPVSAPVPLAGKLYGPYLLTERIGAGGMGEVYRANDTRLGRQVAVKILPLHLAENLDAVSRFKREAKVVASLSHANVVALFDFGEEAGVFYAVTELLEGETLRDQLKRGPLTTARALEIALAVANGLAATHANGIIHRDLKPENIFITSDGRVKILDFGIARIKRSLAQTLPGATTAGLSDAGRTVPGMILGTVGYMSPEQVRGEEVDAPSDLFSLGCLLYEMLSGAAPFVRKTPVETLAAILHDEPPALPHHNSACARLLKRCLAKDPAARVSSATNLATELQSLRYQGHRSFAAWRDALTPRRLAVGLLLLAFLLGAALAAGWFLPRAKAVESLAVLPLTVQSGESEAEYLGDGLTDGLISNLSQLSGGRVMPASAVARYKGQPVNPQQIGKDLNVRAVFSGQVTSRAGMLNVTAELRDTAEGRQLWHAQYERKLADVAVLQTELAQQIAATLRWTLSGAARQRLSKRPTDNAEAYQLYLKGRYLLEQYNEASFRRAIELFQQALSLDSGFALAYAGLARGYYELSDLYLPATEMMPKARAAAERALEFDANLAEAYLALALVKAHYDWENQAAFRLFERALELNPNSSTTYQQYGLVLMLEGRTREALAKMQRAQALDPLSSSVAITAILPYYQAPPSERRFDLALAEVRKILALDPNFLQAHFLLGILLAEKGEYPEALAAFQQATQLENDWTGKSYLGYVYGKMGQPAKAQQILRQLAATPPEQHVTALSYAQVYAGLGDKAQTLHWLEQAYANREQNLRLTKVDPVFDFLRAEPQFMDLLRRLKLTA